MTNKEYYFGFKGKIKRADFFVSGVILPILLVFVAILNKNFIDNQIIKFISVWGFYIIALWINIAVSIKRIKDSGSPLWIYPLIFLPAIGFISPVITYPMVFIFIVSFIPLLILIFKKTKNT